MIKFSSSNPIELIEEAVLQVNKYKNSDQPELSLVIFDVSLKISTSHIPRNYKAELLGKLVNSKGIENILEYEIKPTRFSKIYTSVWIYVFILFLTTPIIIILPSFHWVFILIEGIGLLIMWIGITFSKSGYRKEKQRIKVVLKRVEDQRA